MDDMNELFDVQMDNNERRKGAFGWFSTKRSPSAKALALGVAVFAALSAPVALFAIRNNTPIAVEGSTSETVGMNSSTTLSEALAPTVDTSGAKKTKSTNSPGLVLPVRGSAPSGTTTTTVGADQSLSSTSTSAPPAPPIVLAPATTTAPGSILRTIAFSSTTSMLKTYGDSTFSISLASPSIGSGEVNYSSSNTSVCVVDSSSGEVSVFGAGTCEISATVAARGIYAPAVTTANIAISVEKAPLTIIASSASIAYSPWRYVVVASYAGFVNGENTSALSVLPTCVVVQPNDFEISSNDRRTYATSCSGAEALNYDIFYVGGALTVSSWK